MRKLLLICLTSILLTPVARAQDPDPHFSTPSLSELVQHSAFVHGYFHGYEEGFHTADLRLYAPTYVFNPPKIGKKDDEAYRRSFGDKRLFREGFGYGFQSGYADGISGRSFRALELVRETLNLNVGPGAALDRGLALGYVTGRQKGLRDGRLGEAFLPGGTPCKPEEANARAPGLCEGVQEGYRMGYVDGYQNQYDRSKAQTASR